jgi:Outer membrane lipoprotein
MSDLKLVAPDQPTPLERLLMSAAQNEVPSAEQRMRVRAALGLPPVAVMPPAAVEWGRRAALLKLAAGGLIVVSAAVVLLLTGVGRSPQPVSVALPAPKVAVAVPSAPLTTAPAADLPVAQPLPPLEEAPASAPASKTQLKSIARVASASPANSAADGTDLSEQLRLIDAARAAVAAGNAGAATSALSSYRTRFPRGPFGQEATVLQIETLDLQGNHAQASSLARSFLARHPNSPHVSVVQRVADR